MSHNAPLDYNFGMVDHASHFRAPYFCIALVGAILIMPRLVPAHEQAAAKVFMYTQDLKRNPSNVDLLLARGRAHAELSHTDEAAADFQRALELDPSRHIAMFEMGMVFSAAERHAEALEWLDRYAQAMPESGGAQVWRGRELARLGRDEEAVAAYNRALELTQQPSPETFAELAAIHARAGDEGRQRAIESLDLGLKRIGFMITLELRALDYELEGGDTAAALARLDRIIARSPRKETYLARKADILRKADRLDEARTADAEALRLISALSPARRSAPAMKELEFTIRARLSDTPNEAASRQ